ncbi:MAG: S8 family serine peptidase, partial [Blastocatellia bacterium]
HLISVAIFILAILSAGRFPAHSDSIQRAGGLILDASYRSPSSHVHKVIVQARDHELRDSILAEGGSILEDYGAFALLEAPSESANRLTVSALGSSVRDDMNVLLLRAGAFDTTEAEPSSLNYLGNAEGAEEQLYLVQMIGPVKKQWLNELRSSSEILSYVPNNAYLVRASAYGIARINTLKAASRSFIQWTGSYKPAYKIAPEISLDSDQQISATVQLATGRHTRNEIQDLVRWSSGSLAGQPTEVLNYTNVRIRVPARKLAEIARMSNVVWIEQWTAPQLLDEKQSLIVAGAYDASFTLGAPGYLGWLQTKGLASTPDFIVDISDTGIDQGILDPEVIHKDFLNVAGAARVEYARNVGAVEEDGLPQDDAGHGTLNAAIVGGYNIGTGFPFADADGYNIGIGVHPFVKLGVTKIFNPQFTNPSFTDMLDMMYRDGVRVSSNSWGAYDNNYTADCQLYDKMVRDAQSGVDGNQEMTVVFSSGNHGAGGQLSSPGNGKNIIMVGASENLRPGMDGCRIDTSGADDIRSIIGFSSGGPAGDGRSKPDIVAPGTHIQAARSQSSFFNASGICGPAFFPPSQTLYTWSSGTSHAAPAVAGSAALVRQFFQQAVGHPPSPAMIKGLLTNSSTYLTGEGAGDSLPGRNQGWGLVNVSRAFDGVPRLLIDQDKSFSDTGQVITLTGHVADPSKPFRVTLVWTDAPGNPLANPAVNDLDLQVDVGGQTYIGNIFSANVSTPGGPADKLNNVESVWAPDGVSGDFTIRIVAANIVGDGVPGNGDLTDQDFALVVYNVTDGVGGGGNVDSPPSVNLLFPAGGEHLMAGSFTRILWEAADDNSITGQKVEFSADGVNFSVIANLGAAPRSFDWRIPSIPTGNARIRVSALDGVNLPVSSVNVTPFEVLIGPPDNTPPSVVLLSPNTHASAGGGTLMPIKWRESDNVGVIQRVIEISTDNGGTFEPIGSTLGPASGDVQSFDWQIPIDLQTERARARVTVMDGSGNSASALSNGKFDVWPLPIITGVEYIEGSKPELRLSGRFFRNGETEIWVDGTKLKKIRFEEKFSTGKGTSKKVSSLDKKLHKRVPIRKRVMIEVRIPKSGQVSPGFEFKRKLPPTS